MYIFIAYYLIGPYWPLLALILPALILPALQAKIEKSFLSLIKTKTTFQFLPKGPVKKRPVKVGPVKLKAG